MRPSNNWLNRWIGRIALAFGVVRATPEALDQISTGETDPIDPTTRFEPRDINYKAVVLTGVGTLVGMWIIVLLVFPVFAWFAHKSAASSPPPIANPMPPEPRIQADPRGDLRGLRAYEDSQLNAYHWVDRGKGVVSIPIEQAIRIVAQRGIPPQPPPAKPAYFDPQVGTRVTGFEGKVEPEPR